MKSKFSLGLALMLVALALSFVPAASLGTQTASALSPCDWAQFVADVTVPDGTSFAANAPFTKTWRLKNIGFCTWTTSYALVFDSGNNMGGPASVNLPTSVAPGQTVDVSVNLTAPSSPGHYIGYWKFMNASGSRFGIGSTMNKAWWVEINVGSGSSGVAYDFAANYCAANWFTLQGGLPCPGTDGDPHGFVLKVDNPKLEDGSTDSGSGLITNPSNVFNGDIHGKYPAFHVQHGDRFQATVNCAYGATGCYVTFRLDYQIDGGPIYTYWAFREKYEGLYFRPSIDLSPLSGKDVKFILTVLASGPASGDRALWSNPAIVRLGAPPPPPPPSGNRFDFGTSTSPVASGYTRVTEATAYSSGSFGWTGTSGLESRDRNTLSDDLKRDFVMSSSTAGTFRADIPNGLYAVTVTMGDKDFAHDNMVVKANGATVLGDVDSALGAFTVNTFNVNVTGGNLQLEFSDAGGSDPTWIVNAVTIVPTAYGGSKFDFGTSSSPVASGYTQVTEATAFSSGGFGWTSTSGLESRDRSALADDLKRDFVMHSSAARTFRVDIPNGSYAVTTIMGDNDFAHDNMVVKANGSTVLGDVDAAAGSFPANTFNVNVSGGNLQLEFSDAGGSDPTWVVNAVTIVPTSPPPPTPYGCDKAQFVADITVPDGTVFAPGANFLKIWRLKNVGTCTWTTSYKMIFDTGDQMGGPSSVNMPMVVPPGHTVDMSVNLTAPATAGSYRGYWKFQNAGGTPFGIGFGANKSWWVDIVVSGAPPPPPPPPPPPSSGVKFDFGTATSPLASGYTRVTESTTFSGAFGWTDTTTLESRDRGAPADDLKRDLVTSGTAARTFKVALPNGSYFVTVTMGDNDYAHDNMLVKANAVTVLPDVDSAAGAFTVSTFPVTVSAGTLELEFSDAGGTDPSWVVNGITIGNKFDFGTSGSPVATGYTQVTETSAFSAAAGFGWTDTSALESRDRLAPADDLKRDFVMSSTAARVFKVALLNGSYSVTVTMGDNDYAHDNMVVKANGATVLGDVDSAAGAFPANTFNVTVSGGFLQLEFSDAGGSDTTWVVNGVTVNP